MAEAGAFVRFEKGNRIAVREAPSEVRQAIIALGLMHVPLVALTRTDGETVYVNAHQIRSVVPPEKAGAAFR